MTDTDSGRAVAARVLASRRGLMCGAAGLGAAGALAACGTAEDSSDDSDGGDDPSGGGSGPLAATADVPVGGGVVVDETIIVQPGQDEFLAFSAACPHQGTTVSEPDEDGLIVCPNHGSQFDIEGGLVQGPAETGLEEIEITVEDGGIFAS